MKTIIKNNIKFIIVVLVCIFSSILVTYATGSYLFNSSDVKYDNTESGLDSTNVSDAIDELYFHATDYNEIKTTIGNSTLTTTSQTLTGAINEVNGNLGLPSSASGVSGADAFSKINTLASIPEMISNSNGTAIKFPNGLMICTKTVYKSMNCSSTWGNLYDTTEKISFGSWPVAFTDTPVISATVANAAMGGWIERVEGVSWNSAGGSYIVRPTTQTNGITVHIIAIGKWK